MNYGPVTHRLFAIASVDYANSAMHTNLRKKISEYNNDNHYCLVDPDDISAGSIRTFNGWTSRHTAVVDSRESLNRIETIRARNKRRAQSKNEYIIFARPAVLAVITGVLSSVEHAVWGNHLFNVSAIMGTAITLCIAAIMFSDCLSDTRTDGEMLDSYVEYVEMVGQFNNKKLNEMISDSTLFSVYREVVMIDSDEITDAYWGLHEKYIDDIKYFVDVVDGVDDTAVINQAVEHVLARSTDYAEQVRLMIDAHRDIERIDGEEINQTAARILREEINRYRVERGELPLEPLFILRRRH